MRFSRQDQLATEVRTAKSAVDAKRAARELLDEFKQLPPDQGLLTRVLTFKDDELIERALDELLELDGRGKVRSTPELMDSVRRLRSKNRDVQYLRELLLEKLGSAR